MDWQEIHHRLLKGLNGEIRGHWGRISEIEERLGLSGGYLNKLCKGKHEFKLATFLKTLATVELDPRVFFSRALEIHTDPADYLEQLEDGGGQDRAFDRITRATLELEEAEPPAADSVATADAAAVADIAACPRAEQRRRLRSTRKYRTHAFTRAYLEHLDALRYDHAPEAASLAVEVAVHLIPKLPGPQQERLSLQCLALSVFGAARRLKAELGIAARAYRKAIDVACRAQLRKDRANLMLRASYVLKDFSHFDRALALVNEAMVAFVRLGSLRDVGRALVDHGMMNCHIGNFEDAVLDLRQAQRHLEGTAAELPRYHLTCCQLLSYAFEHLGDLEAAEESLATGSKHFGPRHQVDKAKLEWMRANLAFKRGDSLLAEELLRSARDVLAAKEQPIQEALVTLDLVKVMLALNKAQEASELASDMVRLLGAFKNNRFAQAAVVELVSASLAGNLSREIVNETCGRIEAGARQSQAARR